MINIPFVNRKSEENSGRTMSTAKNFLSGLFLIALFSQLGVMTSLESWMLTTGFEPLGIALTYGDILTLTIVLIGIASISTDKGAVPPSALLLIAVVVSLVAIPEVQDWASSNTTTAVLTTLGVTAVLGYVLEGETVRTDVIDKIK